MQNKLLLLVISIFFLFAVVSSVFFTVSQTEKAIKFKFGEIVKADYSPGLHFKLPIINNIKKFDARIQTMAGKPEQFLTAEKKNVMVDLFVKWRIDNVADFYTAVGGDINVANSRLNQTIISAIRSEFSKRNIKQLVSTDRGAIRDVMMEKSKTIAPKLGIHIVDVQVMRIDLPEEVSASVFSRMEAERERVAREFRSQGAEAAERIRADADRQRVVTLANAYREAEKLRGEGDASAAEIYANAYSQDSEFYNFYRSLSAYKKTFGSSSMIMLDADSEFFQYFKKQK